MNIIIQTADGSNTLYNESIGEHYHSKHGALQESLHVFIEAGLKHALNNSGSLREEISVLEIGFGTGLNYLLSLAYCRENNIALKYTSLEAYPLSANMLEKTGYSAYVPSEIWDSLMDYYENALQKEVETNPNCTLEIPHTRLDQFTASKQFDILYYDAFSVQHQPEMWSDEIIRHACSFLKPGGIFVTYAITGKLKRALKACGFEIQKLPGAPGKREMLRAVKL